MLPLAHGGPRRICTFGNCLCKKSISLPFQMDQVTYPGPPILFHIRMNALMITLSSVDFVMFMIAVDNTLNNGVGGMVLFATEVRSYCLRARFRADCVSLVRYFDGKFSQCHGPVFFEQSGLPESVHSWWRKCSTLGAQEHVCVLH